MQLYDLKANNLGSEYGGQDLRFTDNREILWLGLRIRVQTIAVFLLKEYYTLKINY
jgi:hypothetical protein